MKCKANEERMMHKTRTHPTCKVCASIRIAESRRARLAAHHTAMYARLKEIAADAAWYCVPESAMHEKIKQALADCERGEKEANQ